MWDYSGHPRTLWTAEMEVRGGCVKGILVLLTSLTLTSLLPQVAARTVGGQELCDVDCPNTWDPVCSTKQVTYVNACFLYKSIMCIGLRDVHEAYRGACTPCVSNSTCPSYYDPVCGYDGHTYLNLCTFQVSNRCRGNYTVKYHHRNRCSPDPTSPTCRSFRTCHFLFMPVCGSDGRTYGNTCEMDLMNDCRLEKDKIKVVKDGECMPYNDIRGSTGSNVNRPVCGSDGRTYNNWRKLQEENDQRMDAFKVDIAYMGHCLSDPRSRECKSVTECPSVVELVCASDGNTYINRCELFRKNECREYKQWIHFLHDGSCVDNKGLGKAGPILMKITMVLVIFVVMVAVMVPLYYARRSHQLVKSWNNSAVRYSAPSRGRYHLVASVANDRPTVSIIPITDL